jgi:hypothetical protein
VVRSRLIVLFAPILLFALATLATIVMSRAIRGDAPAAVARGVVAAIQPASLASPCGGPRLALDAGLAGGTAAADPPGSGPDARPAGAWWRRDPELDAAGRLGGWRVSFGAPGSPVRVRSLPAESSVSGPDAGRLVLASDDGTSSTVEVLDMATGCRSAVEVGPGVARGAVADPASAAVFVHLVERETRADLGTWRIDPSGRRVRILPPVPAEVLLGAGIARVWATNLAVATDGSRLAVQSCDPGACVTMVVEPSTGVVRAVGGAQGDLLGFAGDRLITRDACRGLPCAVLAWDAGGTSPTTIEAAALGAAVSTDGRVVLTLVDGTETRAVAGDPATGERWGLGPVPPGTVPVGAASGLLGMEAGDGMAGFVDPDGRLTMLDLTPPLSRQGTGFGGLRP